MLLIFDRLTDVLDNKHISKEIFIGMLIINSFINHTFLRFYIHSSEEYCMRLGFGLFGSPPVSVLNILAECLGLLSNLFSIFSGPKHRECNWRLAILDHKLLN